MIRDERLARITEYVRQHQYVSIPELVSLLGVSKATVRRDLQILNAAGLVSITRGGVSSVSLQQSAEPLYFQKKQLESEEKASIGRAAAEMIPANSIVIIDAGTTTRAMIPYLRNLQEVKLVTNDVQIAADCSNYRGVDVTVTGGQLRQNFFTLLGYAAEESIRNLQADIAFIGFDGIDAEKGCYIANADEVALKRAVLQSSRKVVAVCDHRKFYTNSFLHVCDLEQIDTIITGNKLDRELCELIKNNGVELILVDTEQVH